MPHQVGSGRGTARLLMLCLVALATCATGPPRTADAAPVSAEWAAKWRADLAFAREQFPRAHVNLFHTMPRDTFEAELDRLATRVPTLSHHAIVVELARIVARVGDGHSRVTLPLAGGVDFVQGHSDTEPALAPGLAFHQYPIRLEALEDGLCVGATDAAHADLLGARVTHIGRMTTAEAIETVSPIVQRDNAAGIMRKLPEMLVMPEVLQVLGVVEPTGDAAWEFERPSGERVSTMLSPVTGDVAIAWRSLRDPARTDAPPSFRRPDAFFWFEHVPASRAVYVAYNRVANTDDETVAAFARRLRQFVGANGVERVVIDLRRNDGGDASLNRAFLHELIRLEEGRERGWLFALIGPQTFSAALMFAVDLEQHTNVVFVGEPVGSKPHHHGDARKLRLPNSGVTVRLSTIEWRLGAPGDARETIAPHVPIGTRAADLVAGRDPALAWAIETRVESTAPVGTWKGVLTPSPSTPYPLTCVFTREAGTWRGALSVEGTPIQDVPLSAVAAEGAMVRFVWEREDGAIAFRATRFGDWLLGTIDMQGREGTVTLKRQP